MKQIQLQQNTTIRMNFINEKYHFVLNKLKRNGLPLIILLVALVILLFFKVNNSNNPKSFFTPAIVTKDSTSKTINLTINKKNDDDPMTKYGHLLQDLKQKNAEKKILETAIDACEEKIRVLSAKKSDTDTVSKLKPDTSAAKTEIIKKTNELKVSRIKFQMDSVEAKKEECKEKIKIIDTEITKLNKRIVDAHNDLDKYTTGFVETILQKAEGQCSLKFMDNEYYVCIVNTQNKSQSINFHLKNKSGKNYYSISSLLKDKDLSDSLDFLMVTNGGMYTPKNEPQGLFIENGKIINNLDNTNPNNNTNFYLMPNGVFYMDSNDNAFIKTTAEYDKLSKSIHPKYATQSGPMLVIDGKIHPKFMEDSKNINIRSGVGIMDNNKVVFVISAGYVNFWDFATVFKDIFNCKSALYLDGAISLMYLEHVNKEDVGGNFGPMISVSKRKK